MGRINRTHWAIAIFSILVSSAPGHAMVLKDARATTGIPDGDVGKYTSIRSNSGGYVARFALQVAQHERTGQRVRFLGRCDSSCTLFLSLPPHQTCIAPGAYFRFHAPQAKSAKTRAVAQQFMMRRYPPWVQAWIVKNGGLSSALLRMDFDYASQHLRQC